MRSVADNFWTTRLSSSPRITANRSASTASVIMASSFTRACCVYRSSFARPDYHRAESARSCGLIDVMPTVLDVLGLPAPAIDGISLLQLMRGGRERELEAYSESEYPRQLGWSPLRSLRDGRFKVIDAPRPELYDLERDPCETRNVYHERRRTADAMMRRLDTVVQTRSRIEDSGHHNAPTTRVGDPGDGANAVVPQDLRARLASLGYVSTSPRAALPAGRALPDPKDCINLQGARSCGPDSPQACFGWCQ